MPEDMIKGRVLLRDNKKISQEAFFQTKEIGEKIAKLTDNRQKYIQENNLDTKFCLPDANWVDIDKVNDYGHAYSYVKNGGYDALNLLRFYTQAFSGYQILTLQFGKGLNSVNTIPDNYDEYICQLRSNPDPWVQNWIQLVEKIPEQFKISFPKMLGEIGWNVEGYVVNHDVYVYQERINILYGNGILAWLASITGNKRHLRLFEIGGGYGALAYALHNIFPHSSYFIVDLPEALLFSSHYLSLVDPEYKILICDSSCIEQLNEESFTEQWDFILIPNYMFEQIIDKCNYVDLAINTLSMSEMSEYQVRVYAKGISKLIGEQGAFFEQNTDNRKIGLINCKDYLPEYFSENIRLDQTLRFETQGQADLWTNVSFVPILDNFRPQF